MATATAKVPRALPWTCGRGSPAEANISAGRDPREPKPGVHCPISVRAIQERPFAPGKAGPPTSLPYGPRPGMNGAACPVNRTGHGTDASRQFPRIQSDAANPSRKSDLVRGTKPCCPRQVQSIRCARYQSQFPLHRAPPPLSDLNPTTLNLAPSQNRQTGPKQPRNGHRCEPAQVKAPTVPALPHSTAKSGNGHMPPEAALPTLLFQPRSCRLSSNNL